MMFYQIPGVAGKFLTFDGYMAVAGVISEISHGQPARLEAARKELAYGQGNASSVAALGGLRGGWRELWSALRGLQPSDVRGVMNIN